MLFYPLMKFEDKMSIGKEINRLQDLMPASGRMLCRIVSKPQQSKTITTFSPLPWQSKNRIIYINFDLWKRLSLPERDLLLLYTVAFLVKVKLVKFDVYQGVALATLLGFSLELIQQNIVGTALFGSFLFIAGNKIWKQNLIVEKELNADEEAIKIALTRGYSTIEAKEALLNAIESLPALESRQTLSVTELLRIKNLKKLKI